MVVKEKRQNNVLSFRQRVGVLEIIKPHISQVEGGCVHLNNHTDVSLAKLATETLGFEVSPGHVRYVRNEVFGDIVPSEDAARRTLDRIRNLELTVKTLDERLSKYLGM